MIKRILLLAMIACLIGVKSFAGTTVNPETGGLDVTVDIQEEDGDPIIYAPDTIKVTNGTLTDNADGTVSLDLSGTGSGDQVTVNSTTIDATANFKDGGNVTWTITDGGAGGPDDINASIDDAFILNSAADTMTGNLTINSTDPAIVFDESNATDTDFWLGNVSDSAGDDDDTFQIGDGVTVGTNPFLTIDTDGNVGIGTTGPGAKLDVVGHLYIEESGGGLIDIYRDGDYARFNLSGGTNDYGTVFNGNIYLGGGKAFIGERAWLGYGGDAEITTYDVNEDLTIDPNGTGNIIMQGNVGIGTTGPGAELDVTGTISTTVGFDGTGAVDLDYGSADITDHTFITDSTGTAEIVLPTGSIDGTEILDDTIDSADYAAGSIDFEHLAPDAISGATDTTLASADYLLFWDATDSTLKKVDGAEVTGGGSGAFSDAADPIVQNTITKDVHIGDGAGTLTGKMEIGGDADQPQLVIEGFSTQTDDILIVQKDDDTEVFRVGEGQVTADIPYEEEVSSRTTRYAGVEDDGTITAMVGQGYSNLTVISGTTPDTDIDIDADFIALRDINDVVFVAKTVNETVVNTTSGLNGLDTGSVAADTWYTVWIIAKEDGTTDSLLSVSTTLGTITLPTDYVYGKRVGWGRTDGTSDFFAFSQFNSLATLWDEQIVLSAGTATAFTDVDCSSFFPPSARYGKMRVYFTVANTDLTVRENGTTGTGWKLISAQDADDRGYFETSLDGSQIFEYKFSSANSTYINALAYFDNL